MSLDPSASSAQALAAALRRHLLQSFPADRAYPRSAFRTGGMPPLVAAFLGRTLDRWAEIKRDGLRSDWFDFDAPAVRDAEQQFFDALAHTARVPADAWEDTLGGAVDLVVRFLTTPARALTDAVFEGAAEPLPAAEIHARLPLFEAYPYLPQIAGAYLDRKQTDTLDPDALFGLLDRIDRRVVSDYGPDEWLTLLGPLFALARAVPALDGIPNVVLQRFFEAKGEHSTADILAASDAETLDEAAVRSLLTPDISANESDDEAEIGEPDLAVEPEIIVTVAEEQDDEEAAISPAHIVDASSDDLLDEVDTEEDAERAHPTDSEYTEEEVTPSGTSDTGAYSDATSAHIDLDDAADAADAGTESEGDADDAPEHADPASADAAEADAEKEGEAVPLWKQFARSDADSVNARYGENETDAHAVEDERPAPLWQRFFSRPTGDDAPEPDVTPAIGSEPDATPADVALADDPAPISPVFPDGTSADEPATEDADIGQETLKALEQRVLGSMGPARRSLFIRRLFRDDAGKYATVLHTLDGASSWTEASQIIARDVFRRYRVDIYSEHAIAFTDAVEARFRQE